MTAGQSNSPLDAPAAQAVFAAAMQDPAAFSALHPVPGPVTCIETHVSWVFLTGPFAYKVKKPLRLSFIDYSTAERRAALCHEELRLNRRHAPGLYVDVVPIAGTPAAPRVGATDSPPFEHALRMVQFDPRLELTRLLQSGAIAAGELQEFGKRIAQMHAAAAIAAGDESFGTPDRAHRVTVDNFEEIARALPGRDEAQSRGAVARPGTTICSKPAGRSWSNAGRTAGSAKATATCTAATWCAGKDRSWPSTASNSIRDCASSTSPTISPS